MGTGVKAFLTASLSLLLGFNTQAQKSAPTVSDQMLRYLRKEGFPAGFSAFKMSLLRDYDHEVEDCRSGIPSIVFLEAGFSKADHFILPVSRSGDSKRTRIFADAYYLVSDDNKDRFIDPYEIKAKATVILGPGVSDVSSCEDFFKYLRRDDEIGESVQFDVTSTSFKDGPRLYSLGTIQFIEKHFFNVWEYLLPKPKVDKKIIPPINQKPRSHQLCLPHNLLLLR